MSNLNKKKIISELKFVYSENNTLSVIFKNNDKISLINQYLELMEKIAKTNDQKDLIILTGKIPTAKWKFNKLD